MSRAFRVRVSESIRRVVKAHDRVTTQLEILEVLPGDQMAELLGAELEGRGFEREGDECKREEDGLVIGIDLKTGTVTVSAEGEKEVEVEGSQEGIAYDDEGLGAKGVRENLKEKLKKDLESRVDAKEDDLQSEITDKLEKQLGDVRAELDQAVNRVTAEALKQKAAQMGQIKEMTEDEETGSLTIVVEV